MPFNAFNRSFVLSPRAKHYTQTIAISFLFFRSILFPFLCGWFDCFLYIYSAFRIHYAVCCFVDIAFKIKQMHQIYQKSQEIQLTFIRSPNGLQAHPFQASTPTTKWCYHTIDINIKCDSFSFPTFSFFRCSCHLQSMLVL